LEHEAEWRALRGLALVGAALLLFLLFRMLF
jgi:hypothetical protein